MRLNRIVPIATVALSLCVALPANAQSDEDKAAARALGLQGAKALQENKYAEAIDLVTRAEAIFHAPPHLLMIGRAQVGLGRLVAARENFLKIMREQLTATAPPAFKQAQADAKTDLETIEPRIGSLRISLVGADAASTGKITVKMDDQPVSAALIGVHRPVDPGKHTVSAFVVGRSPVSKEVSLNDGEKKEIELSVETPVSLVDEERKFDKPPTVPPPPPTKMSPLRIAGIAGMGVGAAGLVVGGVFLGISATNQAEGDTRFDTCKVQPLGCGINDQKYIADRDQVAAKRQTFGIAGLVAGGVLAAGGVVLFILGGNKAPPKPAAAFVLPYVAPNGGGIFGEF